jgi:hypothetical protein
MNGRIKRAGNAAERIVRGSVGTIERDGYPAYTGVDNHAGNVFGDQGSVGRERYPQTFVGGVAEWDKPSERTS